jgi:3'-phosphoadenosine 5'-phosphosulfate sulfotransferase (PAPS reductase)/FAD synthetase
MPKKNTYTTVTHQFCEAEGSSDRADEGSRVGNMELVINFSGGKDSCAMLAYICENYPGIKKHVVFADTGWEHKDAVAWCRDIVSKFGLFLNVCQNPNKTFLSMVLNRGKFPAPEQRQCTSDLKRGPIQTWTRRNVTAPVIINCMGMRAKESTGRAKLHRLKRNASMTNGRRTVWDWLPIHHWTEEQVFQYLADRNIPLHPVYKYLRRFSCRICIFMTDHDLKQVAQHDPEAIQIISDLEQKIGFTMKNGKSVQQVIESLK